MNRCALALFTLCAPWWPTSCASSETGNGQRPTATVQLALTARNTTTDGALLLADSDGNAFTVATARAVVEAIKLKLPEGVICAASGVTADGLPCEPGEDTISIEGPWLVDLITGVWSPPLQPFEVAPGGYEQVELKFDDQHTGLVPETDPLHEASLVAEGVLTAGGSDQPFRLRLDFSEEARFDGATSVGADGMAVVMSLAIDASAWFSGIPLVACAENGDFSLQDGALELGDGGGECSSVKDAIKEAIKESNELDGD